MRRPKHVALFRTLQVAAEANNKRVDAVARCDPAVGLRRAPAQSAYAQYSVLVSSLSCSALWPCRRMLAVEQHNIT